MSRKKMQCYPDFQSNYTFSDDTDFPGSVFSKMWHPDPVFFLNGWIRFFLSRKSDPDPGKTKTGSATQHITEHDFSMQYST